MQPRSAAYDAAMASTNPGFAVIAQVVDVYGSVVSTLEPESGSTVTVSRSSAQRRTLRLTIEDPAGILMPKSASDLLAPTSSSRHFIKVARGVAYPGGATETLTLGTFAIGTPGVKDTGSQRQVSLTGSDRSVLIARNKLATSYAVSVGTYVSDAIKGLLDSVVKGRAEFPPNGLDYTYVQALPYPMPSLVVNAGADPWATAQGWAASVGAELYVRYDDHLALVPVADPRSKSASRSYVEGSGCHMTEVDRSMADASPNDWVRDASGPGVTAARGQAYDDNPRSRGFIGGVYGDVQDYRQDTLLTTLAMAQAGARGARNLGLHAQDPATVVIVPDAALVEDDAITVTRTASGFSGDLLVIDGMTIPLSPDATESLTCRKITL